MCAFDTSSLFKCVQTIFMMKIEAMLIVKEYDQTPTFNIIKSPSCSKNQPCMLIKA